MAGVKEDFRLQILKTHAVATEFFKPWKGRDGYAQAIARFVRLNRATFDFLGVKATISTENATRPNEPTLSLTTSRYAGVAPLRSAGDGKTFCNLYVTGQYGEDLNRLLPLLPDAVVCEYSPSLKLETTPVVPPPLFLECAKFVDCFGNAPLRSWQKFESRVKTERQPAGSTMWTDYATRSAVNPVETLTFRNKRNLFTVEHPERKMLNYVLRIAIDELTRHTVPAEIRMRMSHKIGTLRPFTADASVMKTDRIPIHSSDNASIAKLKAMANNILHDCRSDSMAWRIDIAQFFEAFVQHLISKAASTVGLRTENNRHIGIGGTRPAWGLAYLEPDIIVHGAKSDIVVDAKYKSHIYNWHTNSDELHDTFRHDLHQVVSYLAVTEGGHGRRSALLCYPNSAPFSRRIRISDRVEVHLIGVPLEAGKMAESVGMLAGVLAECKRKS